MEICQKKYNLKNFVELSTPYVCVIDQIWLYIGQLFFVFVFLYTKTKLTSYKLNKKNWGQYPAIVTEIAWSIKVYYIAKTIWFPKTKPLPCLHITFVWKHVNTFTKLVYVFFIFEHLYNIA